MIFFFGTFLFFGEVFFFCNLNFLGLSHCSFCLFSTELSVNHCIHFLMIHKSRILIFECPPEPFQFFFSFGPFVFCFNSLKHVQVSFLPYLFSSTYPYSFSIGQFLLEWSSCLEWSSKLSFSLPLPHLIVFHMSFIYSIVILKMVYTMNLDGSWHDIDQAVAIDNVPLLVAHSLFL